MWCLRRNNDLHLGRMSVITTILGNLISFLLIAANKGITRIWRSLQPPSITDWFREMLLLQHMEKLIAEPANMSIELSLTWKDWVNFCSSPSSASYTSLLLHDFPYLSLSTPLHSFCADIFVNIFR